MCFDQAGKDYQIDPLLLMSISIKESHLVPDAINGSNRNGTEDVCGMQVNSSHYGKLKNFNITRERLLNDPCICVYTGAWVLAHNFRSYGKNWDSVGMYNTGPSKKLIAQRKAYAQDIKIYIVYCWPEKSCFLNVWRQLRERSMRLKLQKQPRYIAE
jgi:soluble lytic murein transglycosylase-like protein